MSIPTITVAVRTSDGACFHWDETNPPGLYSTLMKQIKRCLPQSFDGLGRKWRSLIKELVAKRRPARVRLIVGFQGNAPVFDELTYRPR